MKIEIWSKPNCKYCDMAKNLLKSKNINFSEKMIGEDATLEELRELVPNAKSVPQIIVSGKPIGGFTELKGYIEKSF